MEQRSSSYRHCRWLGRWPSFSAPFSGSCRSTRSICMFVIYAKSLKLRHLSADSAEIIADRLRPTKHFAQLFVGPFILVPTFVTVRVALWRKLGTLKADWWSQSFPSEGHGTVERSSVEMDPQKWADLVSFFGGRCVRGWSNLISGNAVHLSEFDQVVLNLK